jgi:hypothetical protein
MKRAFKLFLCTWSGVFPILATSLFVIVSPLVAAFGGWDMDALLHLAGSTALGAAIYALAFSALHSKIPVSYSSSLALGVFVSLCCAGLIFLHDGFQSAEALTFVVIGMLTGVASWTSYKLFGPDRGSSSPTK